MILLSWRTFITVTVDVSSLSIISPAHSTHSHSHSCCRRSKTSVAAALKFPFCSISSFQDDIPPVLQKSQLKPKKNDIDVHNENDFVVEDVGGKGKGGVGIGGGGQGIHGIQVPRQQYISVSKSDLLNAIVSMFHSQQDIDQFLHLSSCLDSIIHAEHKSILEEMRLDYNLTHSVENEGNSGSEVHGIPNDYKESDLAVDKSIGNGVAAKYVEDKTEPKEPLPSNSSKNVGRNSFRQSRVAVATRFQHAFVQLLYNAQFEELSAWDLTMTSALNSDYLLTLPIYVDWKKASESNAIIFRRGYTTERQKGLLIVEKLDYLQSKFLQGFFLIIARPLRKIGNWMSEAFESASQGQDAQFWTKRIKLWLKELSLFQQADTYSEQTSDNLLGVDQLSDSDLPIWLAAQRAVTRYEGILSPVGPRGQLLRKLLIWIGLVSSTPKPPFHLDFDPTTYESYLRPVFLSRISLSDIWEPATRKSCGNDLWKMMKASVSVLLSQSILQEPAFQDLILLYTEETGGSETEDKVAFPSLKLKVYEKVSIPDLPVVFPHKKLSFRILDTVRLDVATILGLLAYFINYKFEDILSSPSAILLDAIAITALIVYVTRVALGYKQTWDRYQLLVNRTLYEKTLASGFGSVHFLLDASEQQQYKETILAYAILLKVENDQHPCRKTVRDRCEQFLYNSFEEKVEMPVDKALKTLVRLGLVTEKTVDGKIRLQVVPCLGAHEVLKQRWNSLLN